MLLKLNRSLVVFFVAAVMTTTMAGSKVAQASEPFLGQIQMFGFTFAPRGWANCDGQLLSIAQNSALFSLLGTTYGGDGRTTFGLPDLRGRAAIHTGNGPGLSPRSLGQRGGTQTNTLAIGNMPSHTHTATALLNVTNDSGDMSTPEDNIIAQKSRSNNFSTNPPDVVMSADAISVTVTNNGGGQPVNNMSPFLTVRYCIATTGVFPSRN